jgi:rod shape-determining protein MreC
VHTLIKNARSTSLLLVFLLLVAVLLAILYQAGYLSPGQSILLRILSPLESFASSAASAVGGLTQSVRDLADLRSRYQLLEKQANALLIENIQLKEVQSENQTLRKLLSFQQANPDLELQAASIRGRGIGLDPTNLGRYLIIDIGESQGVRRNMPVVTDEGLVGAVDATYATASKVRLISDLNSTVNIILQRSRVSAVAQGSVDGTLRVDWIPQDPGAVAVGDIVLTSGLGGRYPRLIVVGQVVAFQRHDYEVFQSATVRPVVDFQRLEFVQVITGFSPLEGLGESLTVGSSRNSKEGSSGP